MNILPSVHVRTLQENYNFGLSFFALSCTVTNLFSSGACFPKAPETFQARKAIAKSGTL